MSTNVVRRVGVEATAPVFRGHFPNFPILPGVMLVAFARQAVSSELGRPVSLRRIVRQRFMRPVLPDTVVTVECEIGAPGALTENGVDGMRVVCRFKLPDGTLASRADTVMV
jgi:3-hydroxyacyl-[acyl-carrier-protein] dehydratase